MKPHDAQPELTPALPLRAGREGAADLARFVALADGRSEGVVVTDHRGSIAYVNAAAARLLGRAPAQARGKALRELVAPAPEVNAGAARPVLWSCTAAGGLERRIEPSMRPFVDGHGAVTHHVYTLLDVSERVSENLRLAHLAHHDPLTGLPNRALFNDRLQQALARLARHGTCFSLLILDVDGFKSINDRHGHAAGDLVLTRLARRLAACLREEDTVARLGGDEFAVLLSGCATRPEVAVAVDVLLEAAHVPMALPDGSSFGPSVSVGIARCPLDGTDAATLSRLADAAMYGAKRAGGRRARFVEDGAPAAAAASAGAGWSVAARPRPQSRRSVKRSNIAPSRASVAGAG